MTSPFCQAREGCTRDAVADGHGLCRLHADQQAGAIAQLLHLRDLERRLEKRLEELRHEIRVLEVQR